MRHTVPIVLLMLLAAPRCCAAEAARPFEMYAPAQAVRLGQEIMVSVAGGDPAKRLSYAWTATKGHLKPVGGSAVFTPNEAGWADITVRVSDGASVVYERALPLYAFKQFILLKADDLCQSSPGEVSPRWVNYFFYLATEKVKCSAGIITMCLPLWRDESIRFLQGAIKTGMVEFFHHGWNHSNSEPLVEWEGAVVEMPLLPFERPTSKLLWETMLYAPGAGKPAISKDISDFYCVDPDPPLPPPYRSVHLNEFQGTTSAFQREHLEAGIFWAWEKLGITIHTFGPPSGATDAHTAQVVNENPDILALFGECKGVKKLMLTQSIEMERGTGLVDFEHFKKQYEANRDKEYLVLQMHPQQEYFEKHFNSDFKRIIAYLKAAQATFITPMDYLAYLQNGAAPINPLDETTPEELRPAPEAEPAPAVVEKAPEKAVEKAPAKAPVKPKAPAQKPARKK